MTILILVLSIVVVIFFGFRPGSINHSNYLTDFGFRWTVPLQPEACTKVRRAERHFLHTFLTQSLVIGMIIWNWWPHWFDGAGGSFLLMMLGSAWMVGLWIPVVSLFQSNYLLKL